MNTYYFVSLGSNIRPHENVPNMLKELLKLSPSVSISSIAETTPKGMLSTDQTFLNLVACIQTQLTPGQLKQQLNIIETKLGRDREDPLSKKKDRPADIDILFSYKKGESVTVAQLPPEPYVRPFLLELLDFLDIPCAERLAQPINGVGLPFYKMTIGHAPKTLNRASTIGHSRLLQAPLGS
jgi:2-amino-4-hydroxy-6-hydroxymethyldihydropteridine diphosphokinase